MYMFRYRRAKNCKACVINNTNSCATNITIAQPRNAPPKPNREKAIKVLDENGNEVPTFVPNQNTVQDSYFFSDGFGNPNSSNRKLATLSQPTKTELSQIVNGNIFKQGGRFLWSDFPKRWQFFEIIFMKMNDFRSRSRCAATKKPFPSGKSTVF